MTHRNACGGDSRASRFSRMLAHSSLYVLPCWLAVCIASWFGFLGPTSRFTAGTVMAACALAALGHRLRGPLCVRCIEEVPTDAPLRAQRKKRWLWLAHFVTRPSGIAVTITVLVGPQLLSLALPGALSTGIWSTRLRIPMDLWLFAILYSETTHYRLLLWCPYCRGWDDGEPEPSPDPTVFGTKTAR